MARVVQRRTGPPYLLIVFVFLFLITTTLSVLFYLRWDEANAAAIEAQQLRDRFATPEQRQRGSIQQMINEAGTPDGATVVGQFNRKLTGAIQLITGSSSDDLATAKTKADEAYEKVGERPGLAPAVLAAYEQIDEVKQQLETCLQEQEALQAKLDKRRQSVEDAEDTYEGSTEKLQLQLTERTEGYSGLDTSYVTSMEQKSQAWAAKQEDYERRIAAFIQENDELERKIGRLDSKVTELMERLREEGPGDLDPTAVLAQPDGEVLRVMPEENIVYINIGEKSNVIPGITFAVYPSTGVSKEGDSKATLRVSDVSDITSECIILRQEQNNPIVPGDLVANLAFDAIRTYTFVVEGRFDLHGTGEATTAGAKEVAQLIRRFGAKVSDEISVDTDFVVMGQEPRRPPKPPENAPLQVHQVWKDQMEAYDHYQNVKNTAMQMQIPVLNTNRFLAYMGYVPTKVVTE